MTAPPLPDLCNTEVPKVIGLNRLIYLVTDPNSSEYLHKVLWWTYRNFTKPKVILQKFIERFNVKPLDTDPRYYTYWDRTYFTEVKRRIQCKVAYLIKQWIETCYFDFDDTMVQTLKEFCETQLPPAGLKSISDEIIKLMNKVRLVTTTNNRTLENLFGRILEPMVRYLNSP
jgi:hypothetical protein